MTLRHSLVTGLALALGLAAASGLPALAQGKVPPGSPLEKALKGAANAIRAQGGDTGEVLFDSTRFLEEELFPGMWNNVGPVPPGPPLAIIRVYPGWNIDDTSVIIPGPDAEEAMDPNQALGVYPEFLILQWGPGSDCVWRTLSSGDRVKICR